MNKDDEIKIKLVKKIEKLFEFCCDSIGSPRREFSKGCMRHNETFPRQRDQSFSFLASFHDVSHTNNQVIQIFNQNHFYFNFISFIYFIKI